MTAHYYNEFNPYAAQWLRNLIAAGHLPKGEVDERSIADVDPADLRRFRQCHFFAGIGGWALAARLAGWPEDRELWTGSAPCQPFSVAGQGKAQADDRHLWPHLFRLTAARRPAVLMGEQVAAAVGKDWLDGVFADLESVGYACGAVVVPASAVDAPHRRDRLWFVAHTASEGRRQAGLQLAGDRPADCAGAGDWTGDAGATGNGASSLAHAHVAGAGKGWAERGGQLSGAGGDSLARAGDVADADSDASRARGDDSAAGHRDSSAPAMRSSAWDRAEWILGHDGKARRVEPSIRLLAHGVPARVGRLRAYGNAIVPQVAAEVIGAFMDCRP